MIYYSSEAREAALESLHQLTSKIGSIPGDVLSYNDASATIRYLGMLADLIEAEDVKSKKPKICRFNKVR